MTATATEPATQRSDRSMQRAARVRQKAFADTHATGADRRPYRPSDVASGAGSTAKKALTGNYQAIILAEFALCIAFTIITPITTSSAKDGLSPYVGKDIVKLASITILFLLLGMVSQANQGAARLCAWLGGLVLITDGLYEASNISKILQTATGALSQADAGTSMTQ